MQRQRWREIERDTEQRGERQMREEREAEARDGRRGGETCSGTTREVERWGLRTQQLRAQDRDSETEGQGWRERFTEGVRPTPNCFQSEKVETQRGSASDAWGRAWLGPPLRRAARLREV